MAVIDQLAPIAVPEVDERAARRALRDQIARLEGELTTACLDACPRVHAGPPPRAPGGPRKLSLGELERVRDELSGRLAAVRHRVDAQLLRQAESRRRLERMLADPAAHKWMRIGNEQLGEPGCKHYHVRPRLGPVGLLMGWWRVTISSGCPLACGP
jgi:hypothetical protein